MWLRIEAAARQWSLPGERRCSQPAAAQARQRFVGHAVRWLRFVDHLEEPCKVQHAHASDQDFPTLWLIFREADERRPNRHAVVGFVAAGPPTRRHRPRLPAPDDSLWMSGGFAVGPGRCGVSGPCQGGDASRRSSCSRRRVSARLSASRRLAKITASAMLLRLARFAGPWPVRVRQASSP